MTKAIRVQSVVFPEERSCPTAWFALTRLTNNRYEYEKWPEDRRVFRNRL